MVNGKITISNTCMNENLVDASNNNSVFINNINSSQNPEGMLVSFPIRSMIRLYRLNFRSDFDPEIFKLIGESRFVIDEDWKLNSVMLNGGYLPGDIIESRSELVEDISNNESPFEGDWFSHVWVANPAIIFKIVLNIDSVRLAIEETSDFFVEDIKVFLRPQNTAEGPSHWLHMLQYPYGEESEKDTKDSEGARYTRAHQERVYREFGEGDQVNARPPEEVEPQASHDLRSGGYTAKNTHSGSLEDV
jgi:hypothetical protein